MEKQKELLDTENKELHKELLSQIKREKETSQEVSGNLC